MNCEKITVGIPTKDRILELGLLLESLLFQTYQNFDVLIINDCKDEITNTTIQSLIKLLQYSDHNVTILKGERKGPHIAGQKILENSKTELILRLDDDVFLRPKFIEELVKEFKDEKMGAVGPVYLNPHEDIRKQIFPRETSKIELERLGKVFWDKNNDLFLTGVLQANLHPNIEKIPVEHLNSGFLYRKSVGIEIGGYTLDLSPAGHREESDFSYRIFRKGYKLCINPNAIAFHIHPMSGGIRETNGVYLGKQNWDHDEKIFLERIEKLLPRDRTKDMVSVITLTHGPDFKNLKELIEGINQYTNHPYELTVVVNDEEYGGLVSCKDLFKKLAYSGIHYDIIYTNKDIPVTKARNMGARVLNPRSKYICFIDDDARILGRYNQTTDWLDFLCHRFEEMPDTGVVSPVFTWSPELQCYNVSACCMFTSVKVWETVGGFDQTFGNLKRGIWGFEDVDWSYRAQSLGFKARGVGITDFPFYHEFTEHKKYPEAIQQGIVNTSKLFLSKYEGRINKFCGTVYPFTSEQMHIHGTKLNLGCNFMYLDEWINIDINPNCGADQVLDVREIRKAYPPESVIMILLSQCLEHINLEEGKKLVKDIYTILRPGGFFIVEVPDGDGVDERLSKGEINSWSHQVILKGDPSKPWQSHNMVFTRNLLKEILNEAGFKYIQENKEHSSGSGAGAIRFDVRK